MALTEQDKKEVAFRPHGLPASELLSLFTDLLNRVTQLAAEGYILTNNPFNQPPASVDAEYEFRFLLEKPEQEIEINVLNSQSDALLEPLRDFVSRNFEESKITTAVTNALLDFSNALTITLGRSPRLGDLVFHKRFSIRKIRRFSDAGINQVNKILEPLRIKIGMKNDALFSRYSMYLDDRSNNDA